MNVRISDVTALEILDSRDRPTLEVTVVLDDGCPATTGSNAVTANGASAAADRTRRAHERLSPGDQF